MKNSNYSTFFSICIAIMTTCVAIAQNETPISNKFNKAISEKNTEILKSMFKNPEHLSSENQKLKAQKALDIINEVVTKYPNEKIIEYTTFDLEDNPNSKLIMVKLDSKKIVNSPKFQKAYSDYLKQYPSANEKDLINNCFLDIIGKTVETFGRTVGKTIKKIISSDEGSDEDRDRTNEEEDSQGNSTSGDIDNNKDDGKFNKSEIPAGTFFIVVTKLSPNTTPQIESVIY